MTSFQKFNENDKYDGGNSYYGHCSGNRPCGRSRAHDLAYICFNWA